MIDFHTHILPGVDDGSKNVQMSLDMLREEYRQGIETVLLTPHFYAGENSPQRFLERRAAAWRELSTYLDGDGPRMYLGAEVQYFDGISSVEDIRDLCIEGTNMLLVEMPFCHWSSRVVDEVLELSADGIQVVLAHIERYLDMQSADVWEYLRESGIWMQCNISFFNNWKTRRKAMKMLSKGQIQFLGSDCHNMTSRCPKWDQLPAKVLPVLRESEVFASVRASLREAELDIQTGLFERA